LQVHLTFDSSRYDQPRFIHLHVDQSIWVLQESYSVAVPIEFPKSAVCMA
jgi:hypothetical protein